MLTKGQVMPSYGPLTVPRLIIPGNFNDIMSHSYPMSSANMNTLPMHMSNGHHGNIHSMALANAAAASHLDKEPDLTSLGLQPSPAIMANPKARERIAKALMRAQLQQPPPPPPPPLHHHSALVSRPDFMLNPFSHTNLGNMPDFGWTVIDAAKIPYLMRDNTRYVAVRMVETKLLSKYPSTYPDELKHRAPLMSHYCSPREVKLLNHINSQFCGSEYGPQLFTTTDLIVKLSDFEAFYTIVKKYFPGPQANSSSAIDGGWIQMNNTVVPYLLRMGVKHVPLSVIRYAAGLLTDVQVEGVKPTDDECTFLNESCQNAGLNFSFSNATKIVSIDTVHELSPEAISAHELPNQDPFGHAQYQEGLEQDGYSSQGGESYGLTVPVSDSHGDSYGYNNKGHAGLDSKSPSPSLEVNNNGQSFSTPDALDLSKPLQKEEGHKHAMNGRNSDQALHPGFTVVSNGNMTRVVSRQPPPLIKADVITPPSTLVLNTTVGQNHGQYQNTGLGGKGHLQSGPRDHLRPIQPKPPASSPSSCSSSSSSPSSAASVPSQGRPTAALTRAWPREQILLASGVTRPRGRPPKSASSENNKPPPVTTVRVSTPTLEEEFNKIKITAIPFHGRNISCLVKDDGMDGLQPFVLVEALARVFFPLCPLTEFLAAVQSGLPYCVQDLDSEEEQAFIRYYSLPTKKLKCNKIVKLKDIEEYMPKLEKIFKGKTRRYLPPAFDKREGLGENVTVAEDLLFRNTPPPMYSEAILHSGSRGLSTVAKSNSLTNLHVSPSTSPNLSGPVQPRSETPLVPLASSVCSDDSLAERSTDTPTDLALESNGDTQVTATVKVALGQKRPSSASLSGPKAKNPCRSLENAIAKLQNRALAGSSTNEN